MAEVQDARGLIGKGGEALTRGQDARSRLMLVTPSHGLLSR